MSSPKQTSAGFTLIELMIVVAIIAILAAIAVPAYKDYLVRTQLSEGLEASAGAKAAVWEFVHNTGRFPPSNQSAGLPSGASIAGKYVSSIDLQTGGVIRVSYANPSTNKTLSGETLSLSPLDNTGSIAWTCRSTIADRYLPTSCRSN